MGIHADQNLYTVPTLISIHYKTFERGLRGYLCLYYADLRFRGARLVRSTLRRWEKGTTRVDDPRCSKSRTHKELPGWCHVPTYWKCTGGWLRDFLPHVVVFDVLAFGVYVEPRG